MKPKDCQKMLELVAELFDGVMWSTEEEHPRIAYVWESDLLALKEWYEATTGVQL